MHSKIGTPAGDNYKCDFDVEITLDLMRAAEIAKPDIVVLMSGDKDFVPVMLELRKRGIRVEVAAFPEINAAREMMLKASGFIDLGLYVDDRQNPAADDEPAYVTAADKEDEFESSPEACGEGSDSGETGTSPRVPNAKGRVCPDYRAYL